MFDGLLINSKTLKNLQTFLKAPSHSLMLVGPVGSGKTELASRLAAKLLDVDISTLQNYPYYGLYEKEVDKKDFSIDIVRQINRLLNLKTPGAKPIRRVVIVKDAQTLNAQAQNAFLKMLEEPPADTIFILTVDSRESVLPTILSRATAVDVLKVPLEAAMKFYDGYPPKEIEAAWQLSRGQPGLLSTLLTNTDNSVRQATDLAKTFLRLDRYNRLIELSKVSKDKEAFVSLLEGLDRVIRALYKVSAQSGTPSQTKRLVKAMKLVLESQEALRRNGLAKLVAIRLGLNLTI